MEKSIRMNLDPLRYALLDIAGLNDDAVYKWALVPEDIAAVESLLVKALDRVGALSRELLRAQTCKSVELHKQPSSSSSSLPVLPLTVDIHDVSSGSVTYDKAFLLKASIPSDPSTIVDAVSLAAAVVFYNLALFIHHQTTLQVTENRQSLGANIVFQYYEVANDILGKYLERTRRPVWTLQAAIWYNLADCSRFRSSNPASCVYFGQLEAIVGYLMDKDDRVFFERAIVMARMQMRQCFCATVA
jgi:hypothetical protein